MERFPSASGSCVFTALTRLFTFLSALCQGGCFEHQPRLAKGASQPAPSGTFPRLPCGFGEGQQDTREKKLLQVSGSSSCVCSFLHRSGGARPRGMAGGCSVQLLSCTPAVLMLSLARRCCHTCGWGVPCPAGRKAGKFFPILDGKQCWTFSCGRPLPQAGLPGSSSRQLLHHPSPSSHTDELL